ncbi:MULTISPECIES: YwgA family protein [Bacillaceae]|uniref:YwgA family protein n=1 Tax=Bacillaceae TaxID=186817 RepID=UPI001BDF607B|nr:MULTISPECIES: YwgA family protein [Bacillaceae]MDX8361025.1 YwgA family protein [Cytobacillus sp. IB215316]
MLLEHAKVMKAFSEAGEIVGRKKLQKMIFIAKKMKDPFYEKYNFHFYGPYSEELTLRVEELCNLGYIHEEIEKKAGYSQYRYSLTESGEQFLNHYELDMPFLQNWICDLNEQNARFLELVSTIIYFEDLSKDEVKEKVFTIKSKQNYSEEEFEEAITYIDVLRKSVTS